MSTSPNLQSRSDHDNFITRSLPNDEHDGEVTGKSLAYITSVSSQPDDGQQPSMSRTLPEPTLEFKSSNRHAHDEVLNADHVFPHAAIGKVFEAYERRRHRLEEISFHNSSRRMELNHRLDNVQQHLNRLQGSFELFVDRLAAPTSLATSTKPRARKKKLQADLILDFEALKVEMTSISAISEELRGNDRRQDDAERKFNDVTQAITTVLREPGLIAVSNGIEVSLAPTISTTSERSSDLPPPPPELEAYYFAVSQVKNMSERIGDLQLEQQEQWERRGVQEDQGQTLDQSEDEFLSNWKDIFAVAHTDLMAAQTACREARQTCDLMDTVIPPWAEVDSMGDEINLKADESTYRGMDNSPNSSPRDLNVDAMKTHATLGERIAHDQEPPLVISLPESLMANEKVARWVDHVDSLSSNIVVETSNPCSPNTKTDDADVPPSGNSCQEETILIEESPHAATPPSSNKSLPGADHTQPSAPSQGTEPELGTHRQSTWSTESTKAVKAEHSDCEASNPRTTDSSAPSLGTEQETGIDYTK